MTISPVDALNPSLFDAQALDAPETLAAALAPALPGHFDELRGVTSPVQQDAGGAPTVAAGESLEARKKAEAAEDRPAAAPSAETRPPVKPSGLTPDWSDFFSTLGPAGLADLPRRAVSLERQIRDNGVTYNVYADSHGAQRPWALDLFPLLLSPADWARIEDGVRQRTQLLDRVMADVYGPQQLLRDGLLPAALVRGHPGYMRAMHGVQPPGDTWLRIAAFDLARGPDGHWWVVSQRTQAPSGLGYLLENRLAVSRQFPDAFESMGVRRLANTYAAMMQGLQAMCPAGGGAPHIALLTPGPYNETYFEHAYLARYLGVTLVEGSDLTVRDERLFLKTLQGLRPVHGLIKRLDDQFLDPLELKPDSTLGVPGLLQAVRAGNVLVANTPGSAFLESPALLGFLPAIARQLLGQELKLPALPTWWCGERAAMDAVLPQLAEYAIKPTYPGSDVHPSFDAALGTLMDARQLDEWAQRIALQPESHTVQRYMPLSQMPTWSAHLGDGGAMTARALLLRVFALNVGPQQWQVLPGGLARLAGRNAQIASMQRGGSSADVWVRGHQADRSDIVHALNTPISLAQMRAPVTSRAAENMFWLGRYTERAENTLRLARMTLEGMSGDEQASPALIGWLHHLAMRNALVPEEVPDAERLKSGPLAIQSRRVFSRALMAALGDVDNGRSVGFNLRCVRQAASTVRERLSQEHWNHITRAEADFLRRCAEMAGEHGDAGFALTGTLRNLEAASTMLAAITGGQTDRMTRDDAWRLLSIGRHLERLGFLAHALAQAVELGVVHEASGFEAVLALFDSTITFHARYQQRRDMATLVDLLLVDGDNPRSLAWVTQTVRGRLDKLARHGGAETGALSDSLPDPATWTVEALCAAPTSDSPDALLNLLAHCQQAVWTLSDEIATRYFTLTFEPLQPVGV